jgi:hypothetical protein
MTLQLESDISDYEKKSYNDFNMRILNSLKNY